MDCTSLIEELLSSGAIEPFIFVMWGVILVMSSPIVVLYYISEWKLFVKAGEAGWKIFIPFYCNYVLFKIADCTGMFWAMIALTVAYPLLTAFITIPLLALLFFIIFAVAEIIIWVKLCGHLVRAFGYNLGFAVGLFFLPFVFIPIIAFGNAKYSVGSWWKDDEVSKRRNPILDELNEGK